MINIVLVEPEIPQNTGNIARTCAATGMRLHIVKPIMFEISDRTVKRAGLDYWQYLDLTMYENYADFCDKNKDGQFYYCTTKGKITYSDADYKNNGDRDIFLVFGKETAGLPEQLLAENYDNCVRMPMREGARSLNLSNTVAIAVYEALRQTGFGELERMGALTGDFDIN